MSACIDVPAAIVSFVAGTGFFVSADGDLVTNHHVAEAFGPEGFVHLRDGTRRAVRFVRSDPVVDLALYRAYDDVPFPFLPLRDDPARPGEDVCMRFNSLARGERTAEGRVLTATRTIQGIPSIQYDAPSMWGASGSPVTDALGRVVAVHWGWRDNIDFGVTVETLRSFLAR